MRMKIAYGKTGLEVEVPDQWNPIVVRGTQPAPVGAPREALVSKWTAADPQEEVPSSESPFGSGILRHSYKLLRFTERPLVTYPELIYRYIENDTVVDEVSFVPPMRIYYPDEFRKTILDGGFAIEGEWGGYFGEEYGKGPELVVRFATK